MANLAWHFVEIKNGKPVLRDGRPLPAVGEWLEEKETRICEYGLHASWRAIDALSYASHMKSLAACLVEVEDVAQEQEDKFVCHRRKVLHWLPANDLLREFARYCALDVLHLWKGHVPTVVKKYLETGDESIRKATRLYATGTRAAASAAYASADAASAAAADAATYAAYAASSDAYAAASAAAASAAAYAYAASRSKIRDEQNTMLESMLLSAMDYTP